MHTPTLKIQNDLSHQLQKLVGIIIPSHYLLVPYLICFLQREGVWEPEFPLLLTLDRWFFCLLGCGSFHFVPCIPPFFGCFGLFLIGSVSSSSHLKWPSLFGYLGLKRQNLIILFTHVMLLLAKSNQKHCVYHYQVFKPLFTLFQPNQA